MCQYCTIFITCFEVAGGRSIDANQEMFALGVCNFAGSFVVSMPVGGSFSRCAVNSASGVKTTLGGLYSGMIVILCLLFLMPACALIPRATLGAVVFCGVIFTIEYNIIQCPQSEEEYSVATICGFGDESHDLRVKTC